IDGVWRNQSTAAVADKPRWAAGDKFAVLGSVIYYEVHDHEQPMGVRRTSKLAEQRVIVGLIVATKTGIQPIVILDGVKASRKSRIVKRIDVDCVEPHRRNPWQMCLPIRNSSRQRGKQVVDTNPLVHLNHSV